MIPAEPASAGDYKWMAFSDEHDLKKQAPVGAGGDEEPSLMFVKASGSSSSERNDDSLPRVSKELREALSTLEQTFVVSDATKPDYPIMYATSGFFTMTGYSSREVIGRNCRFLQGADTDQNEVAKLRDAVRTGKCYCGRLLNYKKNGTPFWNLLIRTPIKDDTGSVIKFIGLINKHKKSLAEYLCITALILAKKGPLGFYRN